MHTLPGSGQGLCQRQTQAGDPRERGRLGGKRQAQTGAGFVNLAKEAQQEIRRRAGQSRSRVPCHQMPVRLSQSPLSGADEKLGAGVQPDGAGQPLPRATMLKGESA